MARSIHTTRRDVERLTAFEYSRAEQRDAALARACERLQQKRRIKEAVRRERRRPHEAVTSIETIPVVVTDTGEHVHHMASADDVLAVLHRLPPGAVDGLTRVELQLGAEDLAEFEREDPGHADPDPLVGRLGYEGFPGVYSGRVLGTYSPRTAVIRLNAYVFDQSAPLREIWGVMLRLQALSTLVHEVGHHYDHTMRVARGRWLAHGEERVEIYAEDRQHLWMHAVVVPYLRAAYPEEVERLETWIGHQGGVRLTLESLADDPRATHKGGMVSVNATIWSMQQFVEGLVKDVLAGTPLPECRVAFARDLHYRGSYDEALESLSAVLAEEPGQIEALTLRADIYVHQGRDVEALEIANDVLRRAPDHAPAWEVVADAYEVLERWGEVWAAANRMVELYGEERSRLFWALAQRARAALRLGDLQAARADLTHLDAAYPTRREAKVVKELREDLEVATVAQATANVNTSTT